MMKKLQIIVMAVVFVMTALVTHAQEWTKEQTEVWKVVQDTWKGWKTKDVNLVSAAFHDKYQGWSDESPLPMSKATSIEWFNNMKDAMNIHQYNIEPARITVLKTAAVVDYYYYFSYSWTMGDKTESDEIKGKIVEFYVNEGGKWLLLGDMMVHEDAGDKD